MQITSEWGQLEVVNSLAQGKSKAELIRSLQSIGMKGELNAMQHGYASDVTTCLAHGDPDVVAAALEALGNMGEEGAWYMDEIGTHIRASNSKVRAAAVAALGMFGSQSLRYEDQVSQLINDKAEVVKAGAIAALGQIGAEEKMETVSKFLDSPSPVIAAAACQAMGAFSASAEGYADAVAKKLADERLRSAAMSAIANLGHGVNEKYMDEIITKCLGDKDSITRQTAANALGAIGTAVLQSPASAQKIVALLKSNIVGVRCSAALAFGYMGEAAGTGYSEAVAELLSDSEEDSSELYLQMGGGTPRLPPASRRPKCAALIALGMMSAGTQAKECAKALCDESYEVRLCAIECLSGMGDAGRACSTDIASCLEDENFYVRMKACECIGTLKADDAMLQLSDRFEDTSPSVRVATIYAVMESPDVLEGFVTEIYKCLSDSVPAVKQAAIFAIGYMGLTGQAYASLIATFLNDQDGGVRSAACSSLSGLGQRGAAYWEEIEAMLHNDESPAVRAAAEKALDDIGAGTAWEEEVGAIADGE